MKTIIPERITTPAQANEFIENLYNNGELYHIDDEPADIINGITSAPLFTPEEAARVNTAIRQVFEACDPWELPIMQKICQTE